MEILSLFVCAVLTGIQSGTSIVLHFLYVQTFSTLLSWNGDRCQSACGHVLPRWFSHRRSSFSRTLNLLLSEPVWLCLQHNRWYRLVINGEIICHCLRLKYPVFILLFWSELCIILIVLYDNTLQIKDWEVDLQKWITCLTLCWS